MENTTREIRYMWPRFDAGGEGSRGGKIIGHTSSGKPIYMNHKHPSHGEFTQSDHKEAADLHDRLQFSIPNDDPNREKRMNKHGASASDHRTSADFAAVGKLVPKVIRGRRITRV